MAGKTLYERLETASKDSVSTDLSQTDVEGGASSQSVAPLAGGPSWKAKPRTDMVRGERYRGRRIGFCPWSLVTNYHKWFVGKKNGERIRPYHELQALLGHQMWDFYYIWHPANSQPNQYAILVPVDQFESLLSRLNTTLDIALTIPIGNHGRKFRASFGENNTPMPRFLGHATSLESFNAMISSMPLPNPGDKLAGMSHIPSEVRDAYCQKIDGLFRTYEKGKPKNTQKAVAAHKIWGMQFKRVQRYLGLRGQTGQVPDRGPLGTPRKLDLTVPSPYIPLKDAVFVAMDIESYEFNTRMVTEIGFGILDTRDIDGVAPSDRGTAWHKKIQGRHIRIQEHAHAVNRVHVHGCENNFNFGTTEFVKLRDIPALLKEILQPVNTDGRFRQVILVGHSIDCDLAFVKNVGFDMQKDAKFRETIDTQNMYRHYSRSTQNTGLSRLLRELELDYSFLHNGGNDAVYTLQALITLSIVKRDVSLDRHYKKLEAGYKPDPLAVEGGWDTGGEMTDGSTRDVSWKELSDAETTSKSTSTSKSKGKGKAKVVGSTSKPIDVSKITDEQAEALWGEETQEPWGEPYVPPKSPVH